jgi:LemA protein
MDMIIQLGIIFAAIGVLCYLAIIFNGLVGLRNDVNKAWANVDVLLKQRHDELPRLIEVCTGYANFERQTLALLAQARAGYQDTADLKQKVEAERNTSSAIRGVFATAENYPALKANDNFLLLEKRISQLEIQIADRREFYNDSVNTFNTRIRQVPDTFIAALMGLAPIPLFVVENAALQTPLMSLTAAH